MPLFEYQCLDCARQFEYLHLTTSPDPQCPSCGGQKLQRLVSLPVVSSEERSAAHLRAAHKRAAQKRSDKQRSEHDQHHDHFGDSPSRPRGSGS